MSNLCVLPFTGIEADPMGNCKVCCLSTKTIPNINLKTNTLTEAFNSDYMYGLREEFLQGGKPEECIRCWAEEDAGRKSKRQHTLDKFGNFTFYESKLVFLDLKLGNICNLKCRICGSFSSSKWAQEELDIYADNQTARDNLANGRWVRESEPFWNDLRDILSNTRFIEFTGGEPFLIEEHFDLLQFAVENDLAKNIEIHYNTNGTQFPERGLELWPHFKCVEIAVSIDDIGPRFEYQRYGAKWDKVMVNLERFYELRNTNRNITLQLCMTSNAQNFYYIDEMCHWISEQRFNFVYFNVMHDVWYFSISRLNRKAKDLIYDKLKDFHGPYSHEVRNLLQFMQQGADSDCFELVKTLKNSDRIRAQRFSEHHPEIAAAIGYV